MIGRRSTTDVETGSRTGEVADPHALTVIGLATTDVGSVRIHLRVDGSTRRAGVGPLELEVETDGLVVHGGRLTWLVTTNRGWVHLRGTAVVDGTVGERPLRLDACLGRLGSPPGPDRVALRLYPPGSDPNLAGPVVKLMGMFADDAVRLGVSPPEDHGPSD